MTIENITLVANKTHGVFDQLNVCFWRRSMISLYFFDLLLLVRIGSAFTFVSKFPVVLSCGRKTVVENRTEPIELACKRSAVGFNGLRWWWSHTSLSPYLYSPHLPSTAKLLVNICCNLSSTVSKSAFSSFILSLLVSTERLSAAYFCSVAQIDCDAQSSLEGHLLGGSDSVSEKKVIATVSYNHSVHPRKFTAPISGLPTMTYASIVFAQANPDHIYRLQTR